MPPVFTYDGDPPEGGIPANHVVNLSPQQQAAYNGEQFLMAGYNGAEQGLRDNGGKANSWVLVTQAPGTRPGYGPFKVVNWLGATRPAVALYGVTGTESEGIKYDIVSRRFYRDAASSVVPGAAGASANLPPGPGTVQGDTGVPRPIQSIEFSVADDGFWIARTPASSAANKDGNPHPGISIINPGEWERVAGGMNIREALSLDEYKDAGWLGLDKHFLAWQGSDSSPAGEELASAMDAAMDGDTGAQRALRAVGVSPPKKKGFSFGGDIGFHF